LRTAGCHRIHQEHGSGASRARPVLTKLLKDLSAGDGINLTARSTGAWSSDTAVSTAALRNGVVVMPLSRMNVASADTSRLMLGFSGLTVEEADLGTRLLAEVFKGGAFQKVLD
jgi:GntR family transcriptional regulator/MocR family aminotransferase